jgi:hypothetical protein
MFRSLKSHFPVYQECLLTWRFAGVPKGPGWIFCGKGVVLSDIYVCGSGALFFKIDFNGLLSPVSVMAMMVKKNLRWTLKVIMKEIKEIYLSLHNIKIWTDLL